jgi:predicted outer membrane repeat protein
MLNIISSPTLINVVFSGNRATSPFNNHGGAIANYMQSNPTLINVTFSGNSALVGGAIYSTSESRPSIRNSILWSDTISSTAQVFDEPSATTIISDSIIAGGYAGTRNRDADPRFADADGADNTLGTDDDNLRLLPGSPAIDAGSNPAVPPDSADLDGDGNLAEPLPFDRDFSARFVDDPGVADTGAGTAPIVDLGAYEHPIPPPLALAIDYATGQPGSSFLVTGSGFQPDARLRVAVNDMELGLVTTDHHGDITLILRTLPQAAPGEYRVAVTSMPVAAHTAHSAEQLAELRYTLDRAAPLREQAPHNGTTELVVPRAVEPAGQRSVYLPIVVR